MSKFTTIVNGQSIPKGVDDYLDEVQNTVSGIIDSAPAALDTLNELAAALNDDANFATTIATSLDGKQDVVPGVTSTEISYLEGATGLLQLQIEAKAPSLFPKLTSPKETTLVVSNTSSISALSLQDSSVWYYTLNQGANFTLNITWKSSTATTLNSQLGVGDSISCALLVTNGATPYYCSAVQIDGAFVTPKWQGGTAPSAGNASSIDAYIFTIIKTGNAQFTVLGSQTRFA